MNDTTYQEPLAEEAAPERAIPPESEDMPPPVPPEPAYPPEPVPPKYPLQGAYPPPTRRTKDPNAQSERGAVIMILILALVLSLVAVGVGMQWSRLAGSLTFPDARLPALPQLTQPAQEGGLTPAPTGDGTVLILADRPEGSALSLKEIYKQVSPSVVSIHSTLGAGYSEGTGVIMSAEGYIITNEHVISGAYDAQVTLSDGRDFSATLIGSDRDTDLAVLKIDATDLPAAVFGLSDQMEVGDTVVAIGNPLGSQLSGGSTMTDGILSAVNRAVDVDGKTMTLLQTTAALNSGNSGGALVNDQGQVIGITNMKLVDTGFSAPIEGLGFAIPSTVTKTVVDALIQSGHVTGRPMLGVTVRPAYDDELAAAGVDHGLYVSLVTPGSDAEAQGIRAGDLLLAADGLDLTSNKDLLDAKSSLKVGDTLDLVVLRDGETLEITIALVEQHQLDQ